MHKGLLMAIHIKIRKTPNTDNIHCYSVCDNSQDNPSFYVCLEKDKILFYKDKDLKIYLGEIDIQGKDKELEVQGIPTRLLYYVYIKTSQAIKQNNFTDCLDFCA